MSLVARHLEANGIPTVVIGSALDVVEHCGVARFVFTDFPLGNPCGHPYARDMQKSIVAQALRLVREGADTICLHGDGAHAVALVRRLNAELRQAGIEIRAFGV